MNSWDGYKITAWCEVSTKNHRLAALKSFFHYCALEDPALMAIYMDIQQVHPKELTGTEWNICLKPP